MDGNAQAFGFRLRPSALGQMMPMFLWLDQDLRIRGAGPTLLKLMGASVTGLALGDVFQVRRPRRIATVTDLTNAQRLRLTLRIPPYTLFKGVAVPLMDDDGVLLNLSFGYAVRDAVRDHGLSDTDFAATDLAIELLYLAEAKNAVMGEVNKMANRLQGAKARAEEQALTDVLTGLGNRRAMERALTSLMHDGGGFALIHLDLDYFKQVNDTLGHAGDHVLMQVAAALRASVRGADLVARVGGDEFVILLAGVQDRAPLERVGEQIFKRMSAPILFEGLHCKVAISMGAVIGPSAPTSYAEADRLMAQADRALYASKHAGRARLTLVMPDDTLEELIIGGTPMD